MSFAVASEKCSSSEFCSAEEQERRNALASNEAAENTTTTLTKTETPTTVDEDDRGCCFYHFLMRFSHCERILTTWPRTGSLLLGVLLPMALLIGLCFVLGLQVARFEAPREIQDNDDLLRRYTLGNKLVQTHTNLSALVPKLCWEWYQLDEKSPDMVQDRLQDMLLLNVSSALNNASATATTATNRGANVATSPPNQLPHYASNNETNSRMMMLINGTALEEWLDLCGTTANAMLTSRLPTEVVIDLTQLESALSFNWIRCRPGATGIQTKDWAGSHNLQEMQPSAQRAYFTQTWQNDQQALYLQRYHELMMESDQNVTERDAQEQAFLFSTQMASGGSGCLLNAPASGKSFKKAKFVSLVRYQCLLTALLILFVVSVWSIRLVLVYRSFHYGLWKPSSRHSRR